MTMREIKPGVLLIRVRDAVMFRVSIVRLGDIGLRRHPHSKKTWWVKVDRIAKEFRWVGEPARGEP